MIMRYYEHQLNMKYAISMYEGGEEVHAKGCDFNSYSKLGLLCPECKQEVYLRKGNIRKPYFAHLHATSSRQVKQCSLRVSSDGNAIETTDFIEDRGQRLKIFHQQFLSMFYLGDDKIIDNVNFQGWFNTIQSDKNQVINNIIEDCIDYFIQHRQLMEDKYLILPFEIKDKQIMLQQQIALQVMSYLCANAKFNFNLQYLLHHSIYQLYKHEQDKLFKQQIKSNDIDKICHHVTSIIMLNHWVEARESSNRNIQLLTVNASQEIETDIVKIKSQSPIQTFLADNILSSNKGQSNKNINLSNINASKLSGSERVKLQNPIPLHHSFTAYEYGAVSKKTGVRTEKPIMVSCKVVTETYPTEDIAIQFSFMVSEFITADNKLGIKNADGKPVKSLVEIWHPARVYRFSKEFELTVENYTNSLFPNGGYVEQFPDVKTRGELASVFKTIIRHGNIDFIDTLERDNGDVVISIVHDPSVLLLFELLDITSLKSSITKTDNGYAIEAINYESMDETKVVQAFVNAANKAKQQLPLIDGMLLKTLSDFGNAQLKLSNTVTVLKPQYEHEMTGDHVYKKGGGYYDHLKPAKTKMSTGSKLSSSVQKLIDTRLLSPIFQLPEFKYGCQIKVLENGNILLQEYAPTGLRSVGLIGMVTGIHYQRCSNQDIRVFDWSYYDGWKSLWRSSQLEKAIKRHLANCNIDICYFLTHSTLGYEIDYEGNLVKAKKQ